MNWAKWLGVLIVIAAVAAAIYAYGHHQFSLGEQIKDGEWQKRENVELTKANAEIARLTKEHDQAEADHLKRLEGVATAYEQENQHEKAKSNAVTADLRTGNAGLFYALAASQGAVADATSKAGSGTCRGNGGTEAQLPREIAADIFSEADRADGIVRQLNLCQQVVIEDRKVCGN